MLKKSKTSIPTYTHLPQKRIPILTVNPEKTLLETEALQGVPSEWPGYMLDKIQARMEGLPNTRLVVLDDDPTGTQTVHNVPVLTTWDTHEFAEEMRHSSVFYVLTNSRSLPTRDARALMHKICESLHAATQETGYDLDVVSCSDSTLRGHFAEEIDAITNALDLQNAPRLFIPFFKEGRRYTLRGIHYVTQGSDFIPAAQTEYGKDTYFGYKNSDLRKWVEEKTKGATKAKDVVSIDINLLRQGGALRVCETLLALKPGSTAVVDSLSYRDQEVFVCGLLDAIMQGRKFVYRSSASFVRVRAGLEARDPLFESEYAPLQNAMSGGLVVFGSHTQFSAKQLEVLLQVEGVQGIEANASLLLDSTTRKATMDQLVAQVETCMKKGDDAVLYVSSGLGPSSNKEELLGIAASISSALCYVVHTLSAPPRFLIAKGGITSSNVATKGLGVKRAMVLGPAIPGVPVWRLGSESRFPGMAYVIFPGDVGDVNSMAEVLQKARG